MFRDFGTPPRIVRTLKPKSWRCDKGNALTGLLIVGYELGGSIILDQKRDQ
jgi:hypothetical protein